MQKIRIKILKVFLIVSVVSLAASIFVSAFTMLKLKNITIVSNKNIGTEASSSSEYALIDQEIIHAKKYAGLCSDSIDNKFESVANILKQASLCVADIYENPTVYSEIQYSHPWKYTGNSLEMQWILPEGIAFEGEIKNETYMLGNMKTEFKSIMEVNPSIQEIYFTTVTGINIGYDSAYANKNEYFEGRNKSWYINAIERNDVTISDAYQDSFGRGLTVSVSYPCRTSDNILIGVIGIDILINDLNEMVKEVNVGDNGYAMLVSHNNQMISADGIKKDNENDFESFLGSNAKEIVRNMDIEKTGMQETVIDNKEMYVIHSNIDIVDWSMAIVLPKEDIISPASAASNKIQSIAVNTINVLNEQILFTGIIYGILVAIILFCVIYASRRMAERISHPIIKLCDDVKKVGNGNIDYISNINTNDEIEELSKAFEGMTISLKDYINNLARITADKQRIATELNVATQIQTSMLPCLFPAFPNRTEFDIFATMHPAKEVGGDFYDFFLVGDNKLAFVMADVSGKGVPAALFMMISKALIKNLVLSDLEVDEIFEKANNQLNENNDAFMFVTTFLGILDLDTGDLSYVNAGHNTPLLRRKSGTFEWLDVNKNCILAVIPDAKFKKQHIHIEKGDIFYTYTDGVTEAVNSNNEFYSDVRLYNNINNIKNVDIIDIKEIVLYISKTISEFADGAEQADDITMLVFKYLK